MSNLNDVQALYNVLLYILIALIGSLIVLGIAYLLVRAKAKNNPNSIDDTAGAPKSDNQANEANTKLSQANYNKKSVFNFMEFDKVQDSMIIKKNGKEFLMVVECQGVNYDLMSNYEKIAVEEGFIQFLNTLRYSIQIFVQTRTVNLTDSINKYQERVDNIEKDLKQKEIEYERRAESGKYSQTELDKANFEIVKTRNLLEYGRDIIKNTESMNLNKNVLRKKYYVIIPCYASELGDISDRDDEELYGMAFSELYTKARAIVNTLAVCEVKGKILNSSQIVELLYTSFNRDDEEIFGYDKAIAAEYDELYSTAPDVIKKKMKELDKEIDKKALELANQAILAVKTEDQKELERKEKEADDLIASIATKIISDNRSYVGPKTSDRAIEKIENRRKAKKGENENVISEKRKRRDKQQ